MPRLQAKKMLRLARCKETAVLLSFSYACWLSMLNLWMFISAVHKGTRVSATMCDAANYLG
jgi:hypothetical protein